MGWVNGEMSWGALEVSIVGLEKRLASIAVTLTSDPYSALTQSDGMSLRNGVDYATAVAGQRPTEGAV